MNNIRTLGGERFPDTPQQKLRPAPAPESDGVTADCHAPIFIDALTKRDARRGVVGSRPWEGAPIGSQDGYFAAESDLGGTQIVFFVTQIFVVKVINVRNFHVGPISAVRQPGSHVIRDVVDLIVG